MTRTYSNADPEQVRGFAVEAARLLTDLKCTEVVLLDVQGHSQVCDYIVIGSGTSQRQMKSVAADVADLGASVGMSAFRSNRDDGTTWIVVDFVDVVVHLFEPEQRLYYDLELMWSQARRIDWKRSAQPAGAAGATGAAAAAAVTPKVTKPAKEAPTKKSVSKAASKPTTKSNSKSTTKSTTKSNSKSKAAGASPRTGSSKSGSGTSRSPASSKKAPAKSRRTRTTNID
jgi:ribosome-associated protein